MARASLVKLAAAFLAGLVVALASALIYVRVQSPKRVDTPQVIASPAAQVEQAPSSEPEQKPDAAAPPSPSENSDAARVHATPPIKTARRPRAAVNRSQPKPAVQVVQNSSDRSSAQVKYPPVGQPIEEPPSSKEPGAEPSSPIGAPAPPERPQPNIVELAAGTPLSIRLGETLSTDHNYAGDTFRGTLDQPVVRNGFVIADKGSKVLGRIAESTAAGRVRGVANLNLTLTEINTTDGQRIKVETNSVEKQGTATRGADTAKIAGGAALGAIIGALGGGGKGAAIGAGAGGAAGTGVVLATRGKAAVLPSESLLTFQLASPVTITEKLN